MRALRARPPDRAIEWATNAVGTRIGRLVNVRALTGGISSSVHALDIVDARGTRHPLVMRRYLDGEEHATVVSREASTLVALEQSTLPTPCLVTADPSGEYAGAPALLMTRLPGRMLLTPKDPATWAEQIAATLPRIHSLAIDTDSVVNVLDARQFEVPGWARDAAIWRDALAAAQQPPPAYEPCFVHGDYQQFNMLWSRQKLSGIVDWTSSRHGMPERDVGHCRLNFAILWGADAAEDFRLRYESIAGREIDPYWDLHAAIRFLYGWGDIIQTQAGRRLRVDTPGINGRVEDLVATIVRRL
jgi:aminoglycoside phosphotransferase (APT) family kinase protein